MKRRRSMADDLGDLLSEYGVIVRHEAAVSTRGESDVARRKYERMIQRHIAARRRFLERWKAGGE